MAARSTSAACFMPCFFAHAGGKVPLLGRAEDHDLAAQIGAELGQLAQVFRRLAAHVGIGTGQMKALGFGQQPVQPDDFQAGLLRQPPHFGTAIGRDFGDVLGHGERRDLDALVAALGRQGEGPVERPVAERLVADGVFEAGHLGVLTAALFQREQGHGGAQAGCLGGCVRSWRRLRVGESELHWCCFSYRPQVAGLNDPTTTHYPLPTVHYSPLAASQRSASKAAMQPLPAAVMAWR